MISSSIAETNNYDIYHFYEFNLEPRISRPIVQELNRLKLIKYRKGHYER